MLIIGSGPIVIGQAAEFDYAGTQACKAMREEGITSVLANSNPATIMTDEDIADIVYIEPLTVEVLERIIEAERPDGLLPTLGGQTGLNLAVELAEAGVLDRYNVRLLGTPLESIRLAEDREQFRSLLREIGEPAPESEIVEDWGTAIAARDQIGLPLVVRPAYTLGGTGGGIAHTAEEYERIVRSGLAASPITQVLVERSLLGWKELEYEVMRDGADTCVTICNMENLDPMGVHTGDSIVVAPSQTLSDRDYQMLRSSALKIIRALGIEGGCNVQFALAPRPDVDALGGRGVGFGARVPRDRGQPARLALLGAGLEGDGLSDRARRREDRGGQAPGRDRELGHGPHHGRLRARARLLRREDPALAVRQVRFRRPPPRHADEGHRRGDGDRPHLRGGPAEGRPLAGDGRPLDPLGAPGVGRGSTRAGTPPPTTASGCCWPRCAATRSRSRSPATPGSTRGSSNASPASSRWSGGCSPRS